MTDRRTSLSAEDIAALDRIEVALILNKDVAVARDKHRQLRALLHTRARLEALEVEVEEWKNEARARGAATAGNAPDAA